MNLANTNRTSQPTREETLIHQQLSKTKTKPDYTDLLRSLKCIHGQRDRVMQGLGTAERFLPKMEEIFKDMGLPVELTRLSLVESAFNVKAESKAGALGIWQFMPALARNYLFISEFRKIDERLSPLKSTLAAAKLLKWNYEYLGNWILAVTSYNHGLKNLPVVDRDGTTFDDIAYLFDTQPSGQAELGWASRNYYSEFLAMLYVEAYKK